MCFFILIFSPHFQHASRLEKLESHDRAQWSIYTKRGGDNLGKPKLSGFKLIKQSFSKQMI